MGSISARVPDDDEDALETVADLLGEDKSTTIRKALREGLHDLRVREAVLQYQSGKVGIKGAADLAGLSLGEWLQVADERGLTYQLSSDDLERDVEALRDL
jgi:predicted HTH domain antitoxin